MADTITLTDLKTDFGTYLGQNINQVLKLLTQPTETEKFMTTVATKELEYRAAKAVISNIVQGFQKAWTAKGTPAFTPRSIVQRRHKFDVAFYPDETADSWLGFLVDEDKDRKEWPITRYILEQLIIPKVLENRELLLIGKGNYEAVVPDTPQDDGKSMDGFCTQLEDALAAGTSNINFITLTEALTESNIFDSIEDFAKGVSSIYRNQNMRVFVSPDWYMKYHIRRRDLHGQDTNYNGSRDLIEGTNMILTPSPAMASKDIILATPKDNFIRVINRNDGASNISIESVDRQIKIFADWYEAVGFGIEEAVFAYVPAASASA